MIAVGALPMTEDEVREGIQKVWDEAAVAEQKSLAKLETMPAEARKEFLKGLDVYFETLDTYLGEREQEWLKQLPTRKEVANEFQDIADNFSFDFILEESGLSQEEIARRQAVLVQVDTALKAHQAGATGNLGKIFAHFLS